MKTFLKILGAVVALLILIIIGLNIYFNDARLQQTVMPYVNEATGREVQVESMSLTFFSTFPRPGLSIQKMSIPGEAPDDTLMALNELVVGVKLFSLFGDEIQISEIKMDQPRFTYKIFSDSTTNIDFLMREEAAEDTVSEGYAFNIPYFEVINGQFGYSDESSNTDVRLSDLNANIALRYADLIESTVDIELGGLSATVEGTSYVNALPLSLSQSSTINMDEELLELRSGTFSIRGLALNLTGAVSGWSTTPNVNLSFSSSSDNFEELLRLVPAEYQEQVNNLDTRGSLALEGSVSGDVGGEALPAFNLKVEVQNGYMKNPDLPQAIEDIQLSLSASNSLLTVDNFKATAGSNTITGSGSLENPLAEEGAFNLDIDGNVDLATISEFYDISQFNLEQMSGKMDLRATAQGNRANPEEATFDANVILADGMLKYLDVPRAIENIEITTEANQDLMTIKSMSLQAANNTFTMNGNVRNLLDEENRTVDLQTDLSFNLATIKEFYPINEDTLEMSGMLAAQATLQGKASQIEQSIQTGSITLKNGFIFYAPLERPFRNITFESVLEGPKLTIVNTGFQTGENNLQIGGVITDYLSDSRTVDLKLEGDAKLNQIATYYDLRPTITDLNGDANVDFRATGRPNQPAEMVFNGSMTVKNLNMDGEGMAQPITDLNGQLTLSPSALNLDSLSFNFGSSDIGLNGSLTDYMEYLKEESARSTTPHLSGNYYSQYVNVDEIIDWSDTTEVPILIELPNLTSSVKAQVDNMLVTGVNLRNLSATASTTPNQISMDQAVAELFEGKASGSFTWDVPQPDSTIITFNGSLENVRGERFFEEYKILGPKSRFHEFISGAFSSKVDYYGVLDEYLNPQVQTTDMDGNFGMTKSRLKNHPMQLRIAGWLKAQELESVSLDEWNSTFAVSNSILTMKNLRLTSSDVGAELNGTQHLVNETIDYDVNLYLPERFRNAIASIITGQAADALTQENGTIMVPLTMTGTMNDPKVQANQEVIKPIIQQYLKNKAGRTLKKLFGGDDDDDDGN